MDTQNFCQKNSHYRSILESFKNKFEETNKLKPSQEEKFTKDEVVSVGQPEPKKEAKVETMVVDVNKKDFKREEKSKSFVHFKMPMAIPKPTEFQNDIKIQVFVPKTQKLQVIPTSKSISRAQILKMKYRDASRLQINCNCESCADHRNSVKRRIMRLCRLGPKNPANTSQSEYFKRNQKFKLRNRKRYQLAKSQLLHGNNCDGWVEKNKVNAKSERVGYVLKKEGLDGAKKEVVIQRWNQIDL